MCVASLDWRGLGWSLLRHRTRLDIDNGAGVYTGVDQANLAKSSATRNIVVYFLVTLRHNTSR